MSNSSFNSSNVKEGDLLLIHEKSSYNDAFYVYLTEVTTISRNLDYLYGIDKLYFEKTIRPINTDAAGTIYYEDIKENFGNVSLDDLKNLRPEMFI